jgi:hypothetical protein
MMGWKDVHSDMVEKIKYDDAAQELYVMWRRNGRVSIYSDVPADVASQAMTAWSVGDFLNEMIKPEYAHRYQH